MAQKEAENIIRMLIDLVYSLCPDEEYEELYEIQDKLDRAKQYLDNMKASV